jgi:hypothetical protein
MQNYLQSSCVQTAFFFTEPVSKKCGNYTFYVWKAFWCPKRVRNCAAIWLIFSANKSVPANWNKGFCKPLYQRMRRLESFLVTLFKNSESRLKSIKHIAVYILFWAYLVLSLLSGSNLARRYPFQPRHNRLYATYNNETIYATSVFWPRVRARALRAPVFLKLINTPNGRCAPPPSQLRCFPQNKK